MIVLPLTRKTGDIDCYLNDLNPYGISKFKSYNFLLTTYDVV